MIEEMIKNLKELKAKRNYPSDLSLLLGRNKIPRSFKETLKQIKQFKTK